MTNEPDPQMVSAGANAGTDSETAPIKVEVKAGTLRRQTAGALLGTGGAAMSALEFISSVAWPVTILVIALLFREPITEMLSGQLSRMKAGPFEMEWHRAFLEVKTEIGQAVPGAEERGPTGGLVAELSSLAQRSPATAVLEAYDRIEEALRRVVAASSEVDPHLDTDRLGAHALAELAHRAGRLSDQTVQAVEGLSVMRNLAAHGRAGDLTPERAMDYLALVDGVLYAIRREQQPGN